MEAGFTAVKLHEIEPEMTAVLREEFGDAVKIMVDVNGHFDPLEAIAVGRRLGELGVTWFEEPVRPHAGPCGYRARGRVHRVRSGCWRERVRAC